VKKALRVLAVLLAGALAVVAAAALYIHLSGIPNYATETVALKVEVTPERVARGKRTASMLCATCHLDATTGVLSGKRMDDVPREFGTVYAKNITRHPVKGIGGWTDGEIAFLLRTGIRRDGQYTPPWMPKLAHMADEDLHDIIAYLRSDDPAVRATDVDDRESEASFLTKFLCRVAFRPFPYPKQKIAAPDRAAKTAYGRYLVTAKLDCYPCHSADFKTVDYFNPEKSVGFLGGGNPMPDLTGQIVRTANITPEPETGIGKWTEDEFRRAMRHGIRPDNRPLRYPMLPYPELDDEELAAIFAYLRTVPSIRNVVPRGAPPAVSAQPSGRESYYKHSCNSCHGDTGIGLYDLRKGPINYPSDAELIAYMRDPSRFKAGVKMPTWDGVIAEDEYQPLAEYVRSLAQRSAAAP
jgi:mono/diheme cytochrome c family protein